jgi:hypothetical protein
MRTIVGASLAVLLGLAGAGLLRADDKADVAALLDKGIKSLGGEERLGKFKAATWKGKGKYYGLEDLVADFSGDWALQMPDKFRVNLEIDVSGMTLKQTRVLNGDKGWTKRNNEDAEEMTKEAHADEKRQLNMHAVGTLLPLRDPAFKLSPAGEAKVGDRDAVGIKVTARDGREFVLFLDKENGLPLKVESQVKDVRTGKDVKQEALYSDYKEVDGVKRAMKVVVNRDGKQFVEQEISDFKPLEKLDDKTFEKP